MNADLDALATRLYVTIDDLLDDHPEWRPERPKIGIAPQLCDAELVTLAVIQALLGYISERRFIRYAKTHLKPWFPYLPQRAGYNKRLRAAGTTMQHLIAVLARDCPSYNDDLWLADSTPVECGRSRETAKPRNGPTSSDTPVTATAPATPDSFGDSVSTSSPHRPGYPSRMR